MRNDVLALVLGVLILFAGCASNAPQENSGEPAASGQGSNLSGPMPAPENPIQAALGPVIYAPRYNHSCWAIMVQDLETGEIVYEVNPDMFSRTASTAKLFSGAAAMDALGAGYQFETPVYANGERGLDGNLNGDLILVASGDLALGGRTNASGEIEFANSDHGDANALDDAYLTNTDPLAGLDYLARQIRAEGVLNANDVIIDDRLFDLTIPAEHNEYVISPIIINDNLIDVKITPSSEGGYASIWWGPQTDFYSLESKVMTVAPGSPNSISFSKNGSKIFVEGQIAADSKTLLRVYSVKEPSEFARALFIEALERNGVNVSASIYSRNPTERLPESYAGTQSVAEYVSPPLWQFVRMIEKPSHNLGSDTLPLIMAAHSGGKTLEEGMQAERQFLVDAGVDVSGVSLNTGRGNSGADLATPRSMLQFLSYMRHRPDYPEFYDSLPILGVDGSLVNAVSPDSPVRGKMRGKTGTTAAGDLLNGRPVLLVKAVAGYMNCSSGREVAIAVYVSNTQIADMNEMYAVLRDTGTVNEIIYENC